MSIWSCQNIDCDITGGYVPYFCPKCGSPVVRAKLDTHVVSEEYGLTIDNLTKMNDKDAQREILRLKLVEVYLNSYPYERLKYLEGELTVNQIKTTLKENGPWL